jgi:hypothetical protein
LVAAGCASEPMGGTDPSMQPQTMQPQTMQPTGGMQPAAGGGTAPAMSMAGRGTNTGATAGTAAGGAGAGASGGSAGTAAGSGAAGASGAAAGSGGAEAAAGSGGADAAAGSGGAAAGSGGAEAGSGGASAAAGSGGASTAGAGGGAAGAAGAAGTPAEEREDLGEGDGSDVVLIGDSWMSNTLQIEGTGGGVAPSLIAVSGQPYRNYGVQGVELLAANSFGAAIPTQWDAAKRRSSEIKTVVMTAGGNDVIQGSATLQASCSAGTDECKQKLVVISDALDKLWTQMADDGVLDIVHIRYTDNTGTLHPDLQGDKGLPTPKICLSGRVRCHAVPTTDIVARGDLAIDGIHPLGSANDRIAERTYELMTKEGMRR